MGEHVKQCERNNSEGSYEAHQGMSLPILVHLLFVMKKPTIGSVTAPQALPMKSTMEAWKALICRDEHGQAGVKNTRRHKTPGQHAHTFHSLWPQTCYLGDIKQVDLQEEGGGAGGHLLGRATDGEAQFAA